MRTEMPKTPGTLCLRATLIISAALILALSGAGLSADPTVARIPVFMGPTGVMGAVGEVFSFLGYTIGWDPMTEDITLTGASGTLTLTIDEPRARFTDAAGGQVREGTLSEAPRYVGHLLQGPLTSLWNLAGIEYTTIEKGPLSLEYTLGDKRIVAEILPEADKIAVDLRTGSVVKLATVKGDIYLDLFDTQTPIAAGNFLDLVAKKFYDPLNFHRVCPDFMIQGGCPLGTGYGSPGFTIPDEADRGLKHLRRSLSMAKLDPPDTGGSQFFICHVPCSHLDGIHTVFGRCIQGMGIVDRIEQGDKIQKATVIWRSDAAAAAVEAALKARVPDAEE